VAKALAIVRGGLLALLGSKPMPQTFRDSASRASSAVATVFSKLQPLK
jgi:hypothetical protein